MKQGDRIRLISDPQRQGIVLEVIERPDGPTLLVFFGPGEEVYVSARDTEPVFSVAETLVRNPIDNDELAFRYLFLRATERLNDILYSYAASRTDFLPYQFKPVLKFLHSEHRRLYIADEVGLGKTIEAALVFLEYLARADVETALVVCPANLTAKWKRELNRRFALGFNIYRAPEFMEFLVGDQRVPASGLRAICSLQSLRTDGMREAIDNSPIAFDFVVLDEAHNIKNEETASWHLAETLSQRATAMLMLSATPLMLGSDDLFNQLRVLLPAMFPHFRLFEEMIEPNRFLNEARRLLDRPAEALEVLKKAESTTFADWITESERYKRVVDRLSTGEAMSHTEKVRIIEDLLQLSTLSPIYVRTRKREVQTQFPVRRAHVVAVDWADPERRCYEAIREALQRRAILRGGSAGGLAMIMPLRLAASCLPAMAEYFHREADDGEASSDYRATAQESSEIDPSEEGFDNPWYRSFLASTLELEDEVRGLLAELQGHDTKFSELLKLLNSLDAHDAPPKVVLFSFFKKTLRYLERHLSANGRSTQTVSIDGDTPPKERDKLIRKFQQDPAIRLLLSTEVGGEGVDLQSASVLVNYDLPWNPMRVEQRIGRLDRYGQTSSVIEIYNFSLPGTIDAIILDRLYRRIGIFEEYIGDLDPILGDVDSDLGRILFNPRLTDDELGRKLEQVAESIERRKHALEKLEERAKELMGFDEYFQAELETIERQGRYFRSTELAYLTQALLHRVLDEGTTIKKTGRDGDVWQLKASPRLRSLVRSANPHDEVACEFIEQCESGTVSITFDSAQAQREPDLELVTRQHPLLVGLLRRFTVTDEQRDVPVSLVQLTDTGLEGEYAFFGYILERSGLTKHRELRHLLVDRDSMTVEEDPAQTERVFSRLVESLPGWRRSPEELEWFKRAETMTRDRMMAARTEEEERFRKDEDERRRIRTLNVKRETEIRVQRAESIRDQVLTSGSPDRRILRLWEGRIRRLKEEEQRRLDELERLPAPQVQFRFAVAGIAVCQ